MVLWGGIQMFIEQELAERFSLDLERIINNPSEILPVRPAPEEYIEAIALARFMVMAGMIDQCVIREELRSSLLDMVASRKNSGGPGNSDELDDDQLAMVAAGTGIEDPQKNQ